MPRTAPARASAPGGFRPDVEGLRAVAVLLVVFDHLFARPSGGFVGVDVFFVISGFLITGLLVAERERTGRISFRGFYARRARRILPAAMVVLLMTWLVARAVQLSSRAHQTGVDALWSAGFLANVHFAHISTDYFQSDTVHSPVQHYWSLAVEEQFYLFWPVLIVIVAALASRVRRGRAARPALAAVLATGVVASFVFSLQQTRTNPNAAYFATAGRAWELGLGALVALSAPLFRGLPTVARAAGTVVGLAGIVVSAFVIDSGTPFPAPGGLIPVLSAALVIASGVGGLTPAALPITNPAARYVGRVSYSLYLWHWPVLILLADMMPDRTAAYDFTALAAMAALTVASYHWVEAPMRHLHVSALRSARVRLPSWHPPRWRTVLARPGAAVAVCAVITLVGYTLQPVQKLEAITPEVHVPTAGAVKPKQVLADSIDEAIGATRWPDLQPSLDNVVADRAPEWSQCSSVDPTSADECLFVPSGTPTRGSAVVLGDSVAVSWLPGLRDALGQEGYSVRGLTLFQCGVASVSMVEANRGADSKFVRACNAHRAQTYEALARLHPDLVIVSSAENSFSRLVSTPDGVPAQHVWLRGMRSALTQIRAADPGGRIVVLSPPPAGSNVNICAASPKTGPRACVTSIHRDWLLQSQAERTAAAETHAQYIDVHLLFCSKGSLCPSFIDGHLVRCDALHLTATEVRLVAPYLQRALLST